MEPDHPTRSFIISTTRQPVLRVGAFNAAMLMLEKQNMSAAIRAREISIQVLSATEHVFYGKRAVIPERAGRSLCLMLPLRGSVICGSFFGLINAVRGACAAPSNRAALTARANSAAIAKKVRPCTIIVATPAAAG